MENMARCFRRYIDKSFIEQKCKPKVLDIGGANVNGSYRDIIEGFDFQYLAADIVSGDGVDVVMSDPYKIPVEDESIDILISGQAFEHVEFFWLLFQEMARVIKPDGFIFLIAPSAGFIHRHPVDCYRFYPDAFYALGRYVGLEIVEVFHDQRGPWKDLVGVYAKESKTLIPIEDRLINSSDSRLGEAKGETILDLSEEVNVVKGERPYLDFLALIHNKLLPESYFEIGIRQGHSARLANCNSLGVDPSPLLKFEIENFSLIKATSDEFFDELADGFEPPDLAFIDGMHLFEYALRDFINVERNSNSTTVVVIDDIFPCTKEQASRQRKTKVWMGDVWKLKQCLSEYRPDLILIAVDTSPSGLLVIIGLDSDNSVLTEKYNEIVKRYSRVQTPPDSIINRVDAISPTHSFIRNALNIVKIARDDNKGIDFIRAKTKQAFFNTHAAAKALFG
ncbi:methyltransferase domain-containing protein [Alteromonas sp. CYL-A6]|uniref:methyltransferase domain-containing protein n=1 Tax=Alteromonas nitratireducens TaxID=3390813 RepID=UPI0034B784AB